MTSFNNKANVSIPADASAVHASQQPSNYIVSVSKESISNFSRIENDLLIELNDGKSIRIEGYFITGGNQLILADGDQQWLVDMTAALNHQGDGIAEELIEYQLLTDDGSDAIAVLLGLLAGGWLLSQDSGGHSSNGEEKDLTAPAQPGMALEDDRGSVTIPIAEGAVTGDSTPAISGSNAEPNAQIALLIDGTMAAVITPDADGNWRYILPQLADGEHLLSVTQVDSAGNQSPVTTYSFTVDTVAPAAPIIYLPDVTKDNTPTLTGVGEPASTIKIFDNGNLIATVQSSETGSWTFTPAEALDDGTHVFTAQAIDAAGNESALSAPSPLIIDTLAPSNPPTISGIYDDVPFIVGEISSGSSTNDTRPTLSGAGAEANSTVNIYDNDVLLGSVTADASGNWSYAPVTALTDSSHALSVSNVDAAGNEGPQSTPITFTVDTQAPSQSVSITAVTDDVAPVTGTVAHNGTTNDAAPQLSGSLSAALAAGETLVILRNGAVIGTATVSGSTWTYQDSGLVDGQSYSYTARVEDAAGNRGAISTSYAITLDTSAPTQTVAITSYTDDQAAQTGNFASGSSTNDTTPRLNGTLDAGMNSGEAVAVYRDGALLGSATVSGSTWSFQDSGLLDGQSYSYTARVVDAAGNLGSASAGFSLSIDTQAPASAPTIGSVLDDVPFIVGEISSGSSTNDTRPTLSGAGAEANSTVNIYDNDVLLGSVSADASGNWTYTPVTALTDSSHALSVSNVDAAGNEGPQSAPITFTVDTQAPSQSVSITAVTDDVAPVTGAVAHNGTTNDATPQLSGTLSAGLAAGETLVILRNGAVIGTATVSGSTWTYQDSGLVDGQSYSYTARVEDAAGNRGAISTSYAITLDTSAPTQTVAITTLLDNVDPVSGPVANGGTTNDSQPELQGTLSGALAGNEVVAIYRDGAKIGTASVNGTGWTFTDTTGLANNTSYSYTARVEDAAGNTGATSSAYSITLQTNGPATTTAITAVTDDVAPVTGTVAHNGTTNDATPQLSGSLSAGLAAGESVVILRDGSVIGTATVNGSTWTYQDSGLVDGQSYSYTARVEDAAGNRGTESNTYAITLDTTAPTQTVTLTQALDNVDPISGAIAAGGTTNDDTPTLQGTLSATLGATEQLHVFRNGSDIGVATVSGTDWSYQDAGLASGSTYTYTAQVVDAAGNSSVASNSLSFTVNTSSVSQTVAILQILDNVDPLQGNVANGATSNDTTPTLSGSISTALSAGDVVEVLRDGSVIGTATVSATTWTYQDSGLVDGQSYSYTARVVIAGGNQGAQSAAYSLSIDTSAPTQTVAITSYTDDQAAQTGNFASGSSTNDTTPRLNGTLDAGLNSGEAVAVYRDGALLGSATVSSSTWSFQDSGLLDGQSYSYTARVVDAAGNLGSASVGFSLSIDTQAPAQSVTITTLTDDVDPIQGNVADNGISNDTSPLLEGTLTAALGSGESVHIYRDGLAIGTADVSGTSWSFQDNGLAGGDSYVYTARVVDAAGNLGALSSAYTVTVDTAAPSQTVSIVSAIDDVDPLQGSLGSGSTTNDTAPQLTGTLSAGLSNGEVLAVLRDGAQVGTASVTGNDWTYQDTGLSDNRTYSYTTRVVDAAGNLGATSSAFALTVDTSAPTQAVTIVSAVDDVDPVQGTLASGSSTNDATPQLNGTLDTPLGTGESVAIYRDGTLIGTATTTGANWTFQEGSLTENTYSYTARVVDTAGNLGAASTAFALTVDTSAPASAPTMVSLHDDVPLVIGEVTSGSTTDDTLPTLNGTGAEADSQVNIYDNGTLLGTSTADATGAWSFTPATALSDGAHAFTVSNVDAAGNEGPQSASIDFIVDTQVPNQVVSIATVTDDMAPITGTVANGGTTNDTSPLLGGTLSSALAASEQVVVLRDGVAIGEATVSGSSWTYQDSGLADGSTYTYTARVDDAAGNQGALSTGYSLIIDASAPAQTVTITAILDDVEPVSGTIADGGTTNDSQPELQGTLSAALAANEVVAVYRNGSKIGEATVNATNWTLTDTTGLADNTSYSYTARVEDAAGNLGSLSNTYGITLQVSGSTTAVTISSVTDDTEPQAGVVASGGYSNDTSPLVAGVLSATLDPAEVVDVLRNGVVIGQATVTDTTWSYQDSGLTDGDYTYLARIRDTGTGNLGADSNAYNLIHIDATAPTQTVILSQAYDNVAPVTGAIADGGTSNDDTPLLGGTLSAVLSGTEQVHVFRNGVDIGVATVSGTDWSYQDTGLANGSTYTYSARVIDAAGNLGSVSNSLSFAVNTSSVSQTVQILQVQDDVDPVQGNVATGGATNDTTPTLSGSISTALSAGDVVEVLRGGSVIGTASVSGTTWTYQDSGLLNGSSYSYTARVVNAGGNQGAQSTAYTLTVDTTAPTQAVTIANYADNVDPNQGNYASGTTTNDTTPQLNGTLSATLGSGETVAIYRDGSFIGTATVSGTNWSYQDAGLADGNTYAYTGRVVDRAGNLGSESAALTLSVDTSTPTQSVLIAAVTDNVDPLQGTVTNGGTTNDTSPQLSGTITTALNTGENVAIYRDGVMLGTATTNGTAWTYQDTGLVDGDSYSYTARVIDAAGNVGAQSASYALTIDTTVPTQTVAINSYQDDIAPNQGSYGSGTISNDMAPQLAGSLSAVLASGEAVAIYRDDVRMGTATVSGTSWVFQDAGLSDASTYTYVARVEDAAGNAGAVSAVFTLSVDTTAPSQNVSIVSVIDNVDPGLGTVANTGSTNDNTPQLNGQLSTTLGAGENVAVYRDGVLVGNATVSDTAWTYQDGGLTNGNTYVYTARVVDTAGNPGELSATYTISVDTTVPTQGVTITAVADNVDPVQGAVASGGTTNDDTPQLSGTLTASLSDGETVVVYRDGSAIGTASVSGTTWTFQDSGLVNGDSYVYTARVVDAANNSGPLSADYVITLDTSAPAQTTTITSATDNVDPLQGTLASGSVTNDTTPQLNGTLSNALGAGESVAIYRDGVQIGSATMTGATTWSLLDSGLASGTTYSYTARVMDAAGNLGNASPAFALTVDTAAPTQSVSITTITDNVDPDQGTVASGGTTNDTSPFLSGDVNATLNSGESVVVYRDGVAIGTATMTSATTWTFQDSALVDGVEYSYSARVVDAAGNLGTSSASYSITLDTSAPTQSASITAITDNVDPVQGTVASGSSSNDTSPLLSGTLSASLLTGENLVVFRNGIEIGSASVSGTSWTFQDSGLADGQSYSYSVRVEDSAGNPGSDSNAYSLLIDTSAPTQAVTISSATDDVAPVTGSLSSGAISNDTAPLLNGALSASLNSGESVAIYRNGTLIGAATVSGTTWTFQDSGLTDGASYSYTAQVVDAAGNTGTLSSAFTLAMDSTAPTQTVSISSYTDNVDPSQGVFGSGSTTNDTSPQLTGTLSAALGSGELLVMLRDGVAIGNATVNGTSWSFQDAALLNGTTYAYTARVEDAAGNVGATSSSFSLNVDTIAPTNTVTIQSYTDRVGTEQGDYSNGTTTDDRNPVLNGSVSVALAGGEEVRIYEGTTLLGTATVSGSAWSFTLPALADNTTHTYRAVVIDAAGNEGSFSGDFTLTVDLKVEVNAQNTLDTTPVVTGGTGFVIQEGEYLEVTINGTTYSSLTGAVVVDPQNNTWYVQIPTANALSAGSSYEVAAVLKNASGNVITQDDTTGELYIANPPAAPAVPASADVNNKATAMTIGEDGQWRIFSNMTVLDANGSDITSVASFSSNTVWGNDGVLGTVTFMDMNRDGYMDIAGQDSRYNDGQQAFMYMGDGYTQTMTSAIANGTNVGKTNTGYYAFQIGNETTDPARVDFSGGGTTSAETYTWFGGTALYDKVGDGYVDIVYGDNTPNDEEAGGGYDTSFTLNNGGIFTKDGALTYSAGAGGDETWQATPEKMISTVDLNNDGAVDITYLAGAGTNYITGNATTTGDNNRFVVASNDGTGNLDVTQIVENMLYNDEGTTFDGLSMTWADFDGDGWLDLFQGRTYGTTTTIQNQSKIFFNDGTGKISATNTDADPINEGYNRHYNMGDTLAGGGSVAVDWNADGRTDVIEIPYFTNSDPATAQTVLLFTNNTSGGTVNFSQSTLTTVADSGAGSAITGILAMDIDWDGDRDAILFTGTAGATLVQNNVTVADGTSLHLRILDQNGINALFGNTVKLYDSAGNLVATQVLNPQSGNQTSDSAALIDFYGLNANETYTAVMLRNIAGNSQDVGGVANIGGYSIENVNAGWTGLTTGQAYDSYVLTAESGTAVNNANIGKGIVGTGYNDTFFATQGSDIYNGGGGTTLVSDSRVWSNTGGEDMVDYKLAGNTAITVDLSNTSAQNTGFGTATFVNIEGIAGGSGADTFTDNAGDNLFDGRGGNDTANLTQGGNDTLLYRLLDAFDATGGNGWDQVNGFTIGTVEATADADRIDLSGLLSGYTADADGAAHYLNGVATMDVGETIQNYLSVTQSSGDTIVSIDRDGSGGDFQSTQLVTLNNVTTDLETLLANHQIVI